MDGLGVLVAIYLSRGRLADEATADLVRDAVGAQAKPLDVRMRGGAVLAPAALDLADLDGRHCDGDGGDAAWWRASENMESGREDRMRPLRMRVAGASLIGWGSGGDGGIGRRKSSGLVLLLARGSSSQKIAKLGPKTRIASARRPPPRPPPRADESWPSCPQTCVSSSFRCAAAAFFRWSSHNARLHIQILYQTRHSSAAHVATLTKSDLTQMHDA